MNQIIGCQTKYIFSSNAGTQMWTSLYLCEHGWKRSHSTWGHFKVKIWREKVLILKISSSVLLSTHLMEPVLTSTLKVIHLYAKSPTNIQGLEVFPSYLRMCEWDVLLFILALATVIAPPQHRFLIHTHTHTQPHIVQIILQIRPMQAVYWESD